MEDETKGSEQQANISQEGNEERVNIFKSTKFPQTRVRNMMKMDGDLHLASQESVFLVCKAVELFVEHLAKEAYERTAQGKRKTIQKKDLDSCVDENDELAFLQGVLE
ncbi:DNA polymerase epsilon subunit 4-like [Dendronephthya gigantea]|uniref:DNA polymerase epsilon subunit 4-like n=1 Tax=Dendronephthya gigantea TaxID=151771 RepID=UPI00106CCCFD|nr:DNA polymerase epsilon subunit 4-like [Dendronephthya gigantea]